MAKESPFLPSPAKPNAGSSQLQEPGGGVVGPPPSTAPPAPAQPTQRQIKPIPIPTAKPAPAATPPKLPAPPAPEIEEQATPPPPPPPPPEPTVLSEIGEKFEGEAWAKGLITLDKSLQAAMDNTSDKYDNVTEISGEAGNQGKSWYEKLNDAVQRIDPATAFGSAILGWDEKTSDEEKIAVASAQYQLALTELGFMQFKYDVSGIYQIFKNRQSIKGYDGTAPFEESVEISQALGESVTQLGDLTFIEFVEAVAGHPAGLNAAQQSELEDMVNDMAADLAPTATQYDRDTDYAEGDEYGEELVPSLLTPPPGPPGRPIQGLHAMTLDEIKTAITPLEKGTTMSDGEWQELFDMTPEIDAELREAMRDIAAGAEASTAIRNQILTGGFELPSYDAVDWLKFAALQPMQAALDITSVYFDDVIKPIASFAVQSLPYVAGGLEDEYHEARDMGMSTHDALGYAWDEWDINWGYKMVMEMAFDPTSYLGWGVLARAPIIGIKGAQASGRVSVKGLNLVGHLDYQMYRGFDQLTDVSKKALGKIYQSSWQKALVVENTAGRTLKKYMEFYSGKYLKDISTTPTSRIVNGKEKMVSDWAELIENAILSVQHGAGRISTDMQMVGKILLGHAPLSATDIVRWSSKVGGVFTKENISPTNIEQINMLFEATFYRTLSQKKAGAEILKAMGAAHTPENMKIVGQELIARRSAAIKAKARGFKDTDNAYKTVKQIMKRAGLNSFKWDEHKVALKRLHASAWKKAIYDMEPQLIASYRHYIGELMVKNFAEAYLTFGAYGYMNIIEDYMRSVFGGVMPRRMNLEEYRMVTWALSTDPNLEAAGINEMMGPMRAVMDDTTRSNWVINLMMSPLSVPAWGITKGKVTPKMVGNKTYEYMVRMPGGWGAETRRYFTYKRYIQELQKVDPERQGIIKSLTDGSELAEDIPESVRKSVVQAAQHAAMSGHPSLIRDLVKTITRRSMHKAELENLMSKYPELPQAAREIVFNHWESGKLFDMMPATASDWAEGYKALKSMEREMNEAILDDFIDSPRIAREQFRMLADELLNMDVGSIQDIAWVTQQLTHMSHIYGSTPTQVLNRAIEKSRGLPLKRRREHIMEATDKIFRFMEDAGFEVERVVVNLRKQADSMMSGNASQQAMFGKYMDVVTARRVLGKKHHTEAMAYRTEYFAGLKSADLRLTGPDADRLWNDFYFGLDDIFSKFKAEDIKLKTSSEQLAQQLRDGGLTQSKRKPVVVKGRPLSAQDLSNLLACETDDITRAMMGVMAAENDRDYFIGHVLGRVKDGDVGFDEESVGAVFDDLLAGLKIDAAGMDWMATRQQQVTGLMQDIHGLYNSKLLDATQKAKVDSYLNRTAQALEDLMHGSEVKPIHDRLIDELTITMKMSPEDADVVVEMLHARAAALGERLDEMIKRQGLHFGLGDDVEFYTFYARKFKAREWVPIKHGEMTGEQLAKRISQGVNYEGFTVSSGGTPQHSWSVMGGKKFTTNSLDEEAVRLAANDRILMVEGGVPLLKPTHIAGKGGVFHKRGEAINIENLVGKLEAYGKTYGVTQRAKTGETIVRVFERNIQSEEQGIGTLTHELGHVFIGDVKDADFVRMFKDFRVYQLNQSRVHGGLDVLSGDDLADVLAEVDAKFIDEAAGMRTDDAFGEWFAESFVKYWRTGELPAGKPGLRAMFEKFKKWLKGTYDAAIRGANAENVPAETRKVLDDMFADVEPLTETFGRWKGELVDFSDFQQVRQSAWDEAEKWYYKEFTDYTNANAIDGAMKAIYPYWTYESQRWQWVPRTFMRRPATFTTVNRYNDNTDYGNIDVPGLPVDINPFRGTIFGPFTNALVRKDYPSYYDNLPPGLRELANTNDLLNHYGFYPGIHVSAPLAWFGGAEHQSGELLPAGFKTSLSLLSAAFPESPHVQWLKNKIVPDRFRDYMIAMEVNRRGMDGGLIHDKMKENRDLTDEEKDIWAAATRRISIWGVLMEQTAMLRFRPDELTQAREESKLAIYEMTGITVQQQDWLYRHGHRVSDQVGGWSPMEKEQLRQLEYYADWGGYNGLVPSQEAEIQRKLSLDWDEVERFSEDSKATNQGYKDIFLAGNLGPIEYLKLVSDEFTRRSEFVEQKLEENPLMTPEGMLKYYEDHGKVPPVQHVLSQLVAEYYKIELVYGYDEFGVYGPLWNDFFSQQGAIDEAIPDEYRAEWNEFLSRNMDEFDMLHKRVHNEYFVKYYDIADTVQEHYSQDEQYLIDEYRSLQKRGLTSSQRGSDIEAYQDLAGRSLISHYNSEVSQNREALRKANPYLDAWLIYWGKATSPQSEKTMDIFRYLADQTGRNVNP